MFYLAILFLLQTSVTPTAGEDISAPDCYDCEEKVLEKLETQTDLRIYNKFCTEGTKISCPVGSSCQAMLMKIKVRPGKGLVSRVVHVLNSTCWRDRDEGNICTDSMRLSRKTGERPKLLSCDPVTDVASQRLHPDEVNEDDTVRAPMCYQCADVTTIRANGSIDPDGVFAEIVDSMEPCKNSLLQRCRYGYYCTDLRLGYETASSHGEVRISKCTESELSCDFVKQSLDTITRINYCFVNGGEETKYKFDGGYVEKRGNFVFELLLRDGEKSKRPSKEFLQSFSVQHCGRDAAKTRITWRKGVIKLTGVIKNVKDSCPECTSIKVNEKTFRSGIC